MRTTIILATTLTHQVKHADAARSAAHITPHCTTAPTVRSGLHVPDKTEIEGHAEQLHVGANRQDQRLTMGANDMRTVSRERRKSIPTHTERASVQGVSQRLHQPACYTPRTKRRARAHAWIQS